MSGFYEVCVESQVGLVRKHNEDFVHVERGLIIVADGMGGHAAGEVASRMAVELLASRAPALREAAADKTALRALLERTFQEASTAIEKAGAGNRMGTTLVCAVLAPDGATVYVAHVGDSRAYVLRDGVLQQVTTDHNVLNVLLARGRDRSEALAHPSAEMLTQAIGLGLVQPDVAEVRLAPEDTLLLCTDGLSDVVDETRIAAHLAGDPDAGAQALIDATYAGGAPDNVTLVIARVHDQASGLQVRNDYAHLRNLVLFRSLDPAELAAVAPFLTTRTYPAGALIADEGDDARECIILTRGSARVMRGDAPINAIEAGSAVGELALSGPWRRNASIHAKEEVHAYILTREAFEELCLVRPRIGLQIGLALARLAAERLTRVTSRLDLVFRSASGEFDT